MATSGTTTYNSTRDDIITEALQICGALPEGGTPNANQLADCSRSLSMMVKSFQAKPGFNLWTIQQGILFPDTTKVQYKVGGSGADNTCLVSDFVQTTVKVAYSAGTSLDVTSTSGMTNGDFIGVVKDDGTLEWKTLTVVDSDTVTLSSALSSAAAIGNLVYTYTTKVDRPLRIRSVFNRDIVSNIDTNIDIVSQRDYDDQSAKFSTSSKVNQLYYNPQITQGLINLWPKPTSVTNLIYFRYLRIIEDIGTGSTNEDFPTEWVETLSWQLAARIGIKYGTSPARLDRIKNTADMMMKDNLDFDAEGDTSIYVGIDMDDN